MPSEKKKYATRGLTRLFRMLGIQFPKDMPKLENKDNLELNTHSPAELRHLPGFDLNERKAEGPLAGDLRSHLDAVAQTNNDWIEQSEAIRVLTPEISRSAEIMVSSIMSPTDMQTNEITITCKNTDLGDELESKVEQLCTDFFNNTLDLGSKLYSYIDTALYDKGSACIMVLPASNLTTLNNILDVDAIKSGQYSFKDIKEAKKQKILPDSSPLTGESKEVFSSSELLVPDVTSTEGLAVMERIESDIDDALLASLEAYNPIAGMKPTDVITKSSDAKKAILDLFKSNKRHVIISSDVSGLTKHNNKLQNISDKLTKEIEKHFMFEDNSLEPIYMADTTEDKDEKRHPVIVEIPTRAVVPVIVPGSPENHIGYFILVDQWGRPIKDMSADRQASFGPRKLTSTATQAAFGMPSLYKFNSSISDEQRFDITSTIFGVTLKKLLESKLEDYGLTGTTIEDYNTVSSAMFRMLVEKKKCSMVFVPHQLMVYFCFKYREDGTGKSITEGMATLLSLRTVLLMSYIMAATENSVDNKTITVSIDEKQTNVQQMLDQIRNAYVSKKMMRFDVNPLTVQQDLIQKSLTIVPKNMKGISDSLDIQTDHKSTGSITPDDSLLEKIDNWIVTWLEVPHSALNQLGDNEYSRSVATSNLFFSNNIRKKQKIVTRHMNKFIRLYLKYSPYLKEELAKLLRTSALNAKMNKSTEADDGGLGDLDSAFGELDKLEKEMGGGDSSSGDSGSSSTTSDSTSSSSSSTSSSSTGPKVSPKAKEKPIDEEGNEIKITKAEKVKKSDIEVDNNTDSINKNLQKIIECISISLPTPKIVVDKAQYEEIEKYISTIEKMCDVLYSDEMLPGESQELSDYMRAIRATVREEMTRDYIGSIGFQSTYDLPFPHELNLHRIKDVVQLLSNNRKGISDWMNLVVAKAKSDDLEGNPDDIGGSSSDGITENTTEDFGNPSDFNSEPEVPTPEGGGGGSKPTAPATTQPTKSSPSEDENGIPSLPI